MGAAGPAAMRYALITGTGRSGTNWLLDILDVSPDTHCRNEPHSIPGGSLNRFPLVWNSDAEGGSREVYRQQWDKRALETARLCGRPDHNIRYPKTYFHPWVNRLGLHRAMTGPRARRATARVDRSLAAREWELPRWLGSPDRLLASTGVLKILLDAPLTAWLLAERPEVPVVHIMRHPGGRLHSWLTRLVSGLGDAEREQVRAERATRMARVRRFDPAWHDLLPEPATLPLATLELWFWRYVNETTWLAGRGHDRYAMVRFDDLAGDPVGVSERIYGHLGLAWSEVVRDRVTADSSRSVFGEVADSRAVADTWRSSLSAEHLEAMDQVLEGSPLADLLV